jgi:hypothetical protein
MKGYCGVWPIKCRRGSKTNKSNCQFGKKSIFDWFVNSPIQDLFSQRPHYAMLSTGEKSPATIENA